MKTTSLLSRLALGTLLTSALIGCPKVPDPDPLEAAPRVLSFTASQSEVAVGATVKLTWNVENATTVKIDEIKLGSISGVSGLSGEVDVAITDDSLYVLTARNARGASDTAVVSVHVGHGAGALLFTALPDTINAGEPVTLAWSAPGATAVTITAAPGGAVDVAGQSASGSITVTPASNTTYTLTAGVRSATTSVTVRPTLLTFGASSLSADAGSAVTLSWTTANATRVQLAAPGRGTLVDETDAAKVAAGSFVDTLPAQVDPGQLFPYQLTVTGTGATLTDSLVVTISGHPAVLTFTAPKYVSQGSDAGITLRWTTRESDAVAIAADGVEFYRAPPTSLAAGSVQLPAPAGDTTYVLTATNSRGGAASSSALVDVVGPPTVSLTATPGTIAAGDPVTLAWSGTNVRNLRISSTTGGLLFAATDTMDTGTATGTFTFAQDSVLRIDADNGAGQAAFATTTVTVSNPLQFTLPTGSPRAGERVDVSWTPASTVLTGLPTDDIVVRSGSTGFDDISATGTTVTFVSSDGPAKFSPVGFSAPFFDRMVGDQVWIDIDGYMSFSPVGDHNWSTTSLPTTKMEPYSIAPCWYDTSGVVGRWQVKDLADGKVLIVQWDARFQVKVFSSGQIDIEYKTSPSCSQRGVRGPRGDTGFPITTTLAANLGLTLFGPKSSPATLKLSHDLPIVATRVLNGKPAGVRFDPGAVVQPNEFSLSEAMIAPVAAVGPSGQWFEFANNRGTPIDLTGWSVTMADGGVAAPLSGVLAPGHVLVVGASTDGALNDDAGVQLALSAALGVDAGSIALSRDGGNLGPFTWTNPTPGVSLINDFGPYRFSTDTSSSVARAQQCVPTTGYGTQGQLGTPGAAGNCGFPYGWQEIRGGYFDISTTGTRGAPADLDDATFAVPMTAAPFTYFGGAKTSANVSTNGFLSFDGSTLDSQFPDNFPSTADANAALVPFGGDLIGSWADSAIYYQRVGANVDPAAAAPHWIVQWHHFSHFDTFTSYGSLLGDELDFQVKLFDDGVIEYHYGRMTSGASTRRAAGIVTVTWLENPAGTQALVINTRSYSPGISPNSAFRFAPR